MRRRKLFFYLSHYPLLFYLAMVVPSLLSRISQLDDFGFGFLYYGFLGIPGLLGLALSYLALLGLWFFVFSGIRSSKALRLPFVVNILTTLIQPVLLFIYRDRLYQLQELTNSLQQMTLLVLVGLIVWTQAWSAREVFRKYPQSQTLG